MKHLRISLWFFFQFCALLCLFFLEYPFGAPLFTITIFILWFAPKSWEARLAMSLCISLALALIFAFSWIGAFGCLLGSFWLARKNLAQGWPQVVVGLLVLVLAIIVLLLLDRSSAVIVWQALATLFIIALFSKTSRQQLRQLWRQRQSRGTQL